MAEIVGSTLGKYDILEELGRGGFGAVYRVRNRDLDREEALKVLGQHRQWDPTFVRRFQREARAAARLRHPHIVTIYEVGEVEGTHFLSMEYLPGRTLAQVIAQEGALPPARVSRLVSQVAEALDYAHAQGLVHRDVKPSNIMVGPDDNITLMDFGLVRAADHSELSQAFFSSGAGITTAAAAMGTPEYMAPELAEPSENFDYRADIYSLGIVAYQALTGRLPFSAPTPVGVLRAQIDLAPPPLTQWVANLPRPVSACVLHALAKNPADRYPSAGGFAAALAEASQQADAERLREEKLAALYGNAQAALDAKNWPAALAASGQVMALNPNYRDVGALFDRANQGLVKQREWEAQQEEMAAQYHAATAALVVGAWDEAIARLQGLATGDQVFRDADRKLAEAQAAKEAEATRRGQQVEALYQKALAAYEMAKRHVAEILTLQPDWRDPEGELNTVIDALHANTRSENPAVVAPPTQIAKKRKKHKSRATSSSHQLPPPRSIISVPAVRVILVIAALAVAAWFGRSWLWPRIAAAPAPSAAVASNIVPLDGMRQVFVPAGEFLMGSAASDSGLDEAPAHRVTLAAFWIDQNEVSWDQYQKCVAANNCAAVASLNTGDGNWPVTNITWQDALNYCTWAGRRLPTEAEWEKAARGADGRKYPWGISEPSVGYANFGGALKHPAATGINSAGQSPYGALDMAGNVWEWVADWYAQDYYASSPTQNPQGPNAGIAKVLRGGAFDASANNLTTTFRFMKPPQNVANNIGFRCAESAD